MLTATGRGDTGRRARPCAASILLVTASAIPGAALSAQTDEPMIDTLFVEGHPEETFGAVGKTHHVVDERRIEALRPLSSAELTDQLPAAQVVTNSRGETLVYLRNATERQVAVFFDGALLNVPWDNRYDLGLLPAGMIARADSAAGPPSPQYGVNALGAVGFTGLTAQEEGFSRRIEGFAGTQGQRGGDVSVSYGSDDASLVGSIGGYRTDGDSLADPDRLPFYQLSDDIRTNTDVEAKNAYFRGARSIGGAELSATVLYADVERGIAPESDRPTDNRFWRYPDARTAMGIVKAETPVGERSDLTSTVWVQDFEQTIDSYTDADYRTLQDREKSRDRTYGSRAILQSDLGPLWLTTSANYLHSRHRQRDIAFEDGALPDPLPEELLYTQNTASLGLDTEYFATDRLTFVGSVGADWVDYVQTGDKPGMEPFLEPVYRIAAAYTVNDSLRLRAAAGRKSRMPTMRELFGQALNRFLINPDLEPERVTTAEVGADVFFEGGRLRLVAFGSEVEDTIDQRRVGGLRQRINLPGSYVAGIEASGRYAVTPQFDVGGDVTVTRSRRQLEEGAPQVFVLERPSVLAHAFGGYTFASGLRLDAEIEHMGTSFSADLEGQTIRLPRATQFHASMNYPVALPSGVVTAYLRASNLTDEYVEPQAGLPAPGRAVIGGIEFTW